MSGNRVIDLRQKPGIVLYRNDIRRPYAFASLEQVLRLSLGRLIPEGRTVDLAVSLMERPDPTPVRHDSFISLHNKLGVLKIHILVEDKRTYSGEHPVRELLEPLLQQLVEAIPPKDAADGPARWLFELTWLDEGYMVVLPSKPFKEEAKAAGAEPSRRLPLAVRRAEEESPPDTDTDTDAAATDHDDPDQADFRTRPTIIVRIRAGHVGEETRDLSDLIRPAPKVEGVIDVDLDRPRTLPFSIRKATAPELPMLDTSGLNIQPPPSEAVTVVLRPEAQRQLVRDMQLSFTMEEGGFLAGRVYRVAPEQDRYVVLVEQVLPAKHTGASSIHFTFTSDSFQEMTRELSLSGGQNRLVGWYHTHLFASEGAMELSSVDVRLHHSTFRQPWQVAGLINLTRDERRLRFYAATEDDMETCSLWVTDERDGHVASRIDLGDR